MQITNTILSTIVLVGSAVAQQTGPPITAPFQLKLSNGFYVAPSAQQSGQGLTAFAAPGQPDGSFYLEGDALVYNPKDGKATYASAGKYDTGSDFPLVSFRDAKASNKGYDHGFSANQKSELVFNDRGDDWWLCGVQASDYSGLALWTNVPKTFPPYPELKGCKKVSIKIENV